MKTVKRLIVCCLFAAPLTMIPAKSHAGIIGDLLKHLFGDDNDKRGQKHDPAPTPAPSNSVPLDGGLSILLAAGLGLGAKKIYDKRKAQPQTADL